MAKLPKPTKLEIRQFDDLMPLLRNEVFHVTAAECRSAIEASGYIEPNVTDLASPFGNSSNGYFRNRGCVSLFDYRTHENNEWNEHAHKCLPTLPLRTYHSIAILFLQSREYSKLVPWSQWKIEEAWSERVVPHVEVGYPGKLPVSAIKSFLIVALAQA
jgi:hypothetical protein